ncbi:DUF6215 domain-containing protein [Streptomyces sp. NPDC006339]|uniref:DUF6215 domain-containing protein n=1 Tax=Streptomyces sp. NPDC006339 TaxID=3156755 RepID=UPI0033A4F248
MAGDVSGPDRGPSVGGQVAAALGLGLVLAGGFWFAAKTSQESVSDPKPAVCDESTASPASRYVSGRRLCEALNRPDLPALLGTPGEQARLAYGNDGRPEGEKADRAPSPEGNVDLATYSLKLSVSYDRLPVATLGRLLGNTAEPTTFLGRPAVLYSDRTLAFTVPLGSGGKAESRTGGIARHLLVAKDPKDGGGSYELVIWREDEGIPDDAALLRVAERVLPTVPGWAATG